MTPDEIDYLNSMSDDKYLDYSDTVDFVSHVNGNYYETNLKLDEAGLDRKKGEKLAFNFLVKVPKHDMIDEIKSFTNGKRYSSSYLYSLEQENIEEAYLSKYEDLFYFVQAMDLLEYPEY